ncbi:hypothetical protein OV208_02680 [Corallococcus sp. bb12-1]|uniref:hypothetical protein n=1 Tax=Corallococcus sp. bb12-1 TaxID=2996784 RepID=UPI00227102FA|nr:hypothetical protein [Corallococcus sp. bb12-1]MCY1040213.1 hypothetical protein [Corallococcus sp. bb12-1]
MVTALKMEGGFELYFVVVDQRFHRCGGHAARTNGPTCLAIPAYARGAGFPCDAVTRPPGTSTSGASAPPS